MNKHLLAATDGSPNAHNSLKYIAGIYQDAPNIDVTLIGVSRRRRAVSRVLMI